MRMEARQLPYDVLVQIIRDVARLAPQQDWGGLHSAWQSNEAVYPLASVARDWYGPTQYVLFESVTLLGQHAADAFSATATRRPDLANRVKNLVLGIAEDDEWTREDKGQEETSWALIRALDGCERVRNLHIRPLRAGVRNQLFKTLSTKSLTTLVCTPRLARFDTGWTVPLLLTTDVQLVLPTLEYLEIDSWAIDAPLLPPLPTAPATPFALKSLKLRIELHPDILDHLLTSCTQLVTLDIYTEQSLEPPSHFATSLLPFSSSLRHIRWISNPSSPESDPANSEPRLFEPLLPQLVVLESLFVTASEIPSNVLDLLPPTVESLEIYSYNTEGLVELAEHFLDVLRDPKAAVQLKSVTVHDFEEIWGEGLEEIKEASRRRGILFCFDAEGDAQA